MIFVHVPKALWYHVLKKPVQLFADQEKVKMLAVGFATKDKNKYYIWADMFAYPNVYYHPYEYDRAKDFVKFLEMISRTLSLAFRGPTAEEVRGLDAALHNFMAAYLHAAAVTYGIKHRKAEGEHWGYYYFAAGLSDGAVESAVKALKFRIERWNALRLRAMDTPWGPASTC